MSQIRRPQGINIEEVIPRTILFKVIADSPCRHHGFIPEPDFTVPSEHQREYSTSCWWKMEMQFTDFPSGINNLHNLQSVFAHPKRVHSQCFYVMFQKISSFRKFSKFDFRFFQLLKKYWTQPDGEFLTWVVVGWPRSNPKMDLNSTKTKTLFLEFFVLIWSVGNCRKVIILSFLHWYMMSFFGLCCGQESGDFEE